MTENYAFLFIYGGGCLLFACLTAVVIIRDRNYKRKLHEDFMLEKKLQTFDFSSQYPWQYKNVGLAISSIVTAFYNSTIGTKVIDAKKFKECLIKSIQDHDFESDRIPGQGFINVPEAIPFISGGMGRNRNNPNDYVLRSYRGKVHAYLKREFAEPVTDCNVVVYTREAYLNDPDINEDPEEARRIYSGNNTHVLVAVLASSGVPPRLSPYRFVKNLAGGNHEALQWTGDEIREKAREIACDVDDWSVVADY